MRDKTRSGEHGFTLVEALLVITIGTVLLGSGTVLYNQYRQSVGDSAAFDRVVALQACVESVYAVKGGSFPNLAELRSYWSWKRPNDYRTSPWGGLVVSGAGDGNYLLGGAASGGVVPNPAAGDLGIMYYWYAPPSEGAITAMDSAGGGDASASFLNYLVAIVPDRYTGTPPYKFVRGSRIGLGAGAGQRVFGQILGGTANTQDPW